MPKKKVNFFTLAASAFFKLLIFLVLVFVLAGRADYWQGWVFCGIAITSGIVISFLFRNRVELIRERTKPGPGMKSWDKIYWALNILCFLSQLVIGILDGGRFFWSPEIPVYVYAIVRHPGYVGAFFIAPSTAIVLGSYWALIPGFLWIVATIWRTAKEDKVLQNELEGYKEYTKKVRYRLIPGIW